jgi:hypothetical protein
MKARFGDLTTDSFDDSFLCNQQAANGCAQGDNTLPGSN